MAALALVVEHLTKRYNEQDIIHDMNFSVSSGEIVAIKGQTAAGKTTLLKLIAGIIAPTSGTIKIFDQTIHAGYKSHLTQIGLNLQEQGVYKRLTPREYLQFFSKLYNVDYARIDEVISYTGLMDRQDEKIKTFSNSLIARVEMARTILHKPRILLLDEPTASLDLETMEILRKVILKTAEEETAVLITTSSTEEADALAHRTGRIQKGKVDSWQETKDSKETIQNSGAPLIQQHLKIEKIPARVNDRIILFDPQELIYIESNEGTSLLHTDGEEFQCPLTLSELEQRLKPFGFFRSHRSYIVNLQRVREVIPWTRNSYSLVLDDHKKTTISLSKNSLKELEGFLGV